ncbi:PREDICTED: translation initiation factor IF-2-like [Chinchilla lanigera]|uniref:translation initiation factor IF-2-like n=1 Tax=Chinchilla lanigera TaxID=34839 RepID=UPI00069635F8|nr:PREDICTED: translation initiation factor IF-2-like [Chinchilla lanigera]
MGCGGAGRPGEGAARRAGRGSSPGPGGDAPPPRPPALVRPLHSSSPGLAAGIADGTSRPASSAPGFQPPCRNLGQGRREQTHTLALFGRPPRPPPQDREGEGASGWRRPPHRHKHRPQVLFCLHAASSALAPHRNVLRGSRPSPPED